MSWPSILPFGIGRRGGRESSGAGHAGVVSGRVAGRRRRLRRCGRELVQPGLGQRRGAESRRGHEAMAARGAPRRKLVRRDSLRPAGRTRPDRPRPAHNRSRTNCLGRPTYEGLSAGTTRSEPGGAQRARVPAAFSRRPSSSLAQHHRIRSPNYFLAFQTQSIDYLRPSQPANMTRESQRTFVTREPRWK